MSPEAGRRSRPGGVGGIAPHNEQGSGFAGPSGKTASAASSGRGKGSAGRGFGPSPRSTHKAPPAELLRALDLTVRRKVDGIRSGDHRSSALGVGTELAQVRPYAPGDDIRQMDWNATARTGQPHVRVHVAERALTTWLALDTSPSMAFGTADRRKADVADGVALALASAATRGVNRLGVLTFGHGEPAWRPPRQGRQGLLAVMTALRDADPTESAGVDAPPSPSRSARGAVPTAGTALGPALTTLAKLARTRSLIVIVTDLRGERDWYQPLLRLCARHEVVVTEIRDRREQELPDMGELELVDPETGRSLRVDTSSRRLRERFSTAAAVDRAEVAALITRAGAEHAVLSTEGDWLQPLAVFLALRERIR